jgi:hypothetical protein
LRATREPKSRSQLSTTTLELTDDELRWLYKLAMGGHAALSACLGMGDQLPVELKEALYKLASLVDERAVIEVG